MMSEINELNKEFLTSCKNEYQRLIDKAKEINIPDWHIDRLKTRFSNEARCGIINALENLKKEIDLTHEQIELLD